VTRRAVSLLIALAACGHRAPDAPAPEAGSVSATVVTLERGPCFGTCPVYRVSLSSGGTVEFVGTRFVSRAGTDTARVAAGAVESLMQSLETAGFFGLADAYVPDAPACGRYHTDAPTVTISVTAPDRSKTVRHDHGCGGAPEQLTGLEQLIDSVAGTARWIGR
jgi:Domain of unknown function (DUF6438)